MDRARPNYDPLGIRIGSFIANAAVSVQGEYSSNVYTDNTNKIGDGALIVAPIAALASNWSNHSVRIVGSADLRRYGKETLKNQNAWYLYANGRIDVTRDLEVTLDGQVDQAIESPFSNDLVANLVNPSRYLRTLASARVQYQRGRSRITAKVERNDYAFSDIRFSDGSVRSQAERDRVIYRGVAIYELALSPSISVYGEGLVDKHDYSVPLLTGRPNRDSTGWNLVAGTNFDLAGLARGSIGVGYSRRNFRASIYPAAKGVSVQAKVEFFPSTLVTVGVVAQRQLQDNSLGDGAAQWDLRMRVYADYELLVNLILSPSVEIGRRSYIAFDSQTNFIDAGFTARYQASRTLGFQGAVNYGSSDPRGVRLSNPFNQFRVSGGVNVRI